ncbi:MAG TPA: sulfite exporter TauE/SafE family protein [Sphingomicrobium sp.]|nr:sulfite exporter TauE/SafE family protein [Sphingomicrobium sp.]
MDVAHAFSGFLVGLLVGMTGVGGGSLMAPILILIFGVAPATAIGTDLWFAGITKSVGGAVHHAKHSADLRVVGRLATGSIPAAIATLVVLRAMHWSEVRQGWLPIALGVVLLVTAGATLARPALHRWILSRRGQEGSVTAVRLQVPLTVLAGAVLGVLVTLTSVGAGALGATLLVFLYPMRLSARQIVGTDIVHAVPLTIVAGIGHLLIGSVDGGLLLSLLIGSIPGIVIGSLLVHKVGEKLVRIALALVLILAGARLIAL